MKSLPLLEVAILIPVYRNATTLVELEKRIGSTLVDKYPNYQIIFIVDASPDESWSIVQHLACNDSRVSGILLGFNQGQHCALMLGLHFIRARRVVVMDADLQDPPELLAALLYESDRTGMSIFALRNGRYQSQIRMLTSRIFKYFLGQLIDLPVGAGTYFVVTESVADKIRCADVKFVQLVVMARMFSSGWSSISYMREFRVEGVSAYSSWKRLQSAMRSFLCVWECRNLMKRKPAVFVGVRQKLIPLMIERINI